MMQEVKNKKIFVIVIFLVTIALIHVCYTSNEFNIFNSNKVGLEMYYAFNGCGLFLPFYILLAFLSNNFVIDNFYKNRQTNFQNFIITREKHKKRVGKEIKLVLLSSFLLRIILHCIVFFVIDNFYSKIVLTHTGDISYYPETFFAFSNNSMISFFLFILYSSIGFSIFSLFLYSVIDFVKNQYIYKASGILFSILLVLLPAFLGNIFFASAGPRSYLETGFLYTIYSAGLLCPGIEVLNVNSYFLANNIYFFVSAISFLLISTCFISYSYKRRKING